MASTYIIVVCDLACRINHIYISFFFFFDFFFFAFTDLLYLFKIKIVLVSNACKNALSIFKVKPKEKNIPKQFCSISKNIRNKQKNLAFIKYSCILFIHLPRLIFLILHGFSLSLKENFN